VRIVTNARREEPMTETITISMRDGAGMGAEILAPAAKGTGIVFIPPIFGIDDSVRDIMSDWAGRGCVSLFIDMFHRTIPGPLGREGNGRELAQKRYGEFDVEQGVNDLGDAIAWLRRHPKCNGTVVVFGYCFGGRYAYLSLTRGLADGAVSFHGTKIGLNLDEAVRVTKPLSIHVGDADASISMDEVRATQKALAGNPMADIRVYPGVVHGFTGKGRPAYDENADTSATWAAEQMIRSIAPRAHAPT
jgi:carboxymethylenebutenolidase